MNCADTQEVSVSIRREGQYESGRENRDVRLDLHPCEPFPQPRLERVTIQPIVVHLLGYERPRDPGQEDSLGTKDWLTHQLHHLRPIGPHPFVPRRRRLGVVR